MNKDRIVKLSRFLSLVLRHEPGKIGIALDPSGWIVVDVLLDALKAHGKPISREELREVVAGNDKQRFAFSDDGQRIRANQGHSVPVDLGYAPATPPALLCHGTADRFLASIRADGLHRGQRHHVHLSETLATASAVGQRHGRLVLLTIRAGDMHRAGHAFFRTPNGVWLTEGVPIEFIDFPAEAAQ